MKIPCARGQESRKRVLEMKSKTKKKKTKRGRESEGREREREEKRRRDSDRGRDRERREEERTKLEAYSNRHHGVRKGDQEQGLLQALPSEVKAQKTGQDRLQAKKGTYHPGTWAFRLEVLVFARRQKGERKKSKHENGSQSEEQRTRRMNDLKVFLSNLFCSTVLLALLSSLCVSWFLLRECVSRLFCSYDPRLTFLFFFFFLK